MDWKVARRGLALLPILLVIAGALWLGGKNRREAAFLAGAGLALGAVFQRFQVCFLAAFRGDRRPALILLGALATGAIGFAVVMEMQQKDPTSPWLPDHWFVERIGWHLAAGGLAFGVGMSLARGCISGHLFRLGEGSLILAPAALAGVAGGFVLGRMAWNWTYLNTIAGMPAVWLPRNLGYLGALAATLAVLAVIAWFRRGPKDAALPAVLIGAIATMTFLRVRPMGLTGEFSRFAGMLWKGTLVGYENVRGCTPDPEVKGPGDSAVFLFAFVLGALACALATGTFRARTTTVRDSAIAVAGGLFMGFGAMIASGCTVGTFLSGAMSFSMHGWIFAVGAIPGVWIGGLVRRGEAEKCDNAAIAESPDRAHS